MNEINEKSLDRIYNKFRKDLVKNPHKLLNEVDLDSEYRLVTSFYITDIDRNYMGTLSNIYADGCYIKLNSFIEKITIEHFDNNTNKDTSKTYNSNSVTWLAINRLFKEVFENHKR